MPQQSMQRLPIIHIDGIVYTVAVGFASLDQVYKIDFAKY